MVSRNPEFTPENSSWCGNPKRGAALGRSGRHDAPDSMRLTLKRIPINSGGYDSGGAYWGIGAPLYWYCSDCGKAEGYFRVDKSDAPERNEAALELYWSGKLAEFRAKFPDYAAYVEAKDKTRFLAKCHVRREFPNATFYR